jgi:hypothetical protein
MVNNLHDDGIKIFPNPLMADQKLIVSLKEGSIRSTVRVLNLNGVLIYETMVENKSAVEINCAGMNQGIYFVQVTNSKQKIIETFTVK